MKLRTYPDPILTQVSELVTEFDDELKEFCKEMTETMIIEQGIGLSAVQVGLLKRIVTMYTPGSHPLVFINPDIREEVTKRFTFSEGCLSVPDYFEDRERSDSILLHWDNVDGSHQFHWFEGIDAFCIQHEMDHLEGKLFIDDLSPLKKSRIRTTIEKSIRRSNGN